MKSQVSMFALLSIMVFLTQPVCSMDEEETSKKLKKPSSKTYTWDGRTASEDGEKETKRKAIELPNTHTPQEEDVSAKAVVRKALRVASGLGAPQDAEAALNILTKAAREGNELARFIIGKEDQPIPRDQKEARNIIAKCLFEAGCRLHAGLGVRKQLNSALKYYELASFLGHEKAEENKNKLLTEL